MSGAPLRFVTPPSVAVHRLSQLSDDWRAQPNLHGDHPEIDFGCCEPFRCLSDEDLARVRVLVEEHRHKALTTSRSTSLRGVEALNALFGTAALEKIVSDIVGADLCAHPMKIEHAHVNLQTKSATDAAVDDWHQDYVPFVFIFMISRDASDNTGALRTRGFGDHILSEGEAIIVQGSHVEHRADACSSGERITVVTSLAPRTIDYRDMTRVKRGAVVYSEDDRLPEQAAKYRWARIRARAAKIATLSDDASSVDIDRELAELRFEHERWLDAR